MTSSILDDRAAQLLMAVDCLDYDVARSRLDSAALILDAATGLDAAHQAALLAAVACGVRMFKGGVFVSASATERLSIGQGRPWLLRRALAELGAKEVTPPPSAVRLHIGLGDPGSAGADLYAWCSAWTAFVGPQVPSVPLAKSNVLAGVAAGAVAISEVFRRAVLGDVVACKRQQFLSVWGADEPPPDAAIRRLPRSIWLLGLGNLGQATLFVLNLLPWADASEILLLLNDPDYAGPENLDVQVLTAHSWIGRKKARSAAEWAEQRGFTTIMEERRFSKFTKPTLDEPLLALSGVDNLAARRLAAAAGFDLMIDAGLGATGPEAFDIRIHAFPGTQEPDAIWPESAVVGTTPDQLPRHLSKLVEQRRLDLCGAMTIAGKSVGVPCTALAAAALQVAQACRALMTGRCADRIDLSLPDLRRASWRLMPAPLGRLPLSVDALPAG
jgi:molybdopterin/thiamine biosynthesis adenylyltransferase